MLDQLAQKLRYRLSLPLPGNTAHLRMAHAERRKNLLAYKTPEDAKKSAILILLYEDEHAIKTIMIKRQTYDGVHSGQVAFPGGRWEENDKDFFQTALREANEEVGIIREDVTLVGQLSPLYIPPSNFLVFPFIGATDGKPFLFPDENEVAAVLEVNLEKLADESIIGEKEIVLSNGLKIVTPCYNIDHHIIWGATAMIISELNTLLKEIEN